MANYQNILRQAHQAIADVADNADSWRAFLRSAAYTTHYAFPNQALIYSQRPGATMLADIDTWNRAAGRWVNRGAHGVASLGTGNMAGNVRYLFDIKDTHPAGKASKPLGWQITDANRYPTLQALQEKHSAESLPEIFGLQAALFVAQYGKQLDADLQNAVIGSTLEWAKPQEQTAIFANLITQSAVYMAAVRCGLGDSAVPQDAFADIDRFDTESAVLALGNAVNRAGRQMFAEIGAVVKSIDSVAKTQPKQYDVNVSKTNQQEVQDHGYDESERVSGAQDGNDGNTQTAGRKNRSAAGEVPAREPLPAVRQDAAGRDTVQRPETDRAALLGAGGADHHEAAGQQPGTGQEPESAELTELSAATSESAEPEETAVSQQTSAPTATPIATPEPTATPAPTPSATPAATSAPTPAPTPEPTAAPTAEPAPAQVSMSYGAVPFDLAAGTEQWWSIDSSDSAYWAVQENINAMRAAGGLAPLTMDGGLSAAADARCESFVAGGPFDHSGMTTRSEICAAGPLGSASAVCTGWQGSPAHYANIMEPSFTSMGVGCWFCQTAEGQYTYWVVTFN